MKKISTLFMGILVALSAVAAPQFTVKNQDFPVVKKAGIETKKIDWKEAFTAEKAVKAPKARVTRLLTNDAVSGITFAQCAYYPSYGFWELDVLDADTNLVSSFLFKNGQTRKIAGTYVADANKTAVVQHIPAAGDTVLLQGSFSIAYDSEGDESSKYHVTATGLVDSLSRSFDFDFTLEIAAINFEAYQMYRQAYQYAYYYYQLYMSDPTNEEYYEAMMYYLEAMDYYADMIDIELTDAPIKITGDTMVVAINDMLMTDKQATAGWWWIQGYNADSTIFVSLSNVIDSTRATAVGTYTTEDLDFDYSYVDADGKKVHFEDLDTIHGSVVVSMNEDGTYHVEALLLGRDGNMFDITLNSKGKSDNIVTITYSADDDVLTFAPSNSDTYFIAFESKEEYDKYQKDFSQESLNAEVDLWIEDLAGEGYVNYYTFSGKKELNLTEFMGEHAATGDYVALAAPIFGQVRNGEATYLLIHYVLPEGVENVEAAVKAVKFLRNGQLIIRKNGAEYNAFGARVK